MTMTIKTDCNHLTQTERKYIKLAYDYCINDHKNYFNDDFKNDLCSCKVNTKTIQFDFTNKKGIITSGKKVKCMDGQYRPEVLKRFSWE